jgi:adenylosuccinate lyase
MTFAHDTFISPFTWRYGSPEMRYIWSEVHKRQLMRQVWLALATAQHQAGLVSAEQLADLQAHVADVDIERALEIEKETRHDVMAEIRTYAEQCPVGGGIIHWGATSADITDNVDALRLREAAVLLRDQLMKLLEKLAEKIEETAVIPTMAHTHIQPAEPTTLGYRFAVYAQDLLEDLNALQSLIAHLRGKGLKGAVGTQASYAELLQGSAMTPQEMETAAMAQLKLPYFLIATQTYTRQQDLRVQQVLAGIAASLHKFAWTSAFCSRRLLANGRSRLAKNRWGLRPCRSSAIPSTRKTFARWPATSPLCRRWPGTTPARPFWSAAWTIPPTAASSRRKAFWRRKRFCCAPRTSWPRW